jgi:hypothetical protein
MQREPSAQAVSGYFKAALADILLIVFSCCVWYVGLGPKGILVGFGQYFVVRFAFFFERVFSPRQKR